ncbi:MAG: hypothetical protein Hyperionvirus1_78 [Hyperionvirus sp.]|uniref:Uncharacterized protein n=1 Tax=Hyperionvirus sp. TaxID=2487770 RepID=A0A3G5AB07_9VIRU|nr:MAG: hypothetical protein Hyperionvirus1_78 [Hyperionvirus sp.]
MSYYQKYLKYKRKYQIAKLLHQKGGDTFTALMARTKEGIKGFPTNNAPLGYFVSTLDTANWNGTLDLTNNEHTDSLWDMGQFLQEKVPTTKLDYVKTKIAAIPKNIKTDVGGNEILEAIFGEGTVVRKTCSVDELMSFVPAKLNNVCENLTKVSGSCGTPSYLDSIKSDISEGDQKSFLELFSAIRTKLGGIKPEKLILDIGATSEGAPAAGGNLVLRFIPGNPQAEKIGAIIDQINTADNLKGKTYWIDQFFPLDNTKERAATVINSIKDLMTVIPVVIYNRICGTCFRSFYYLAKYGAEYSFQGAQGKGVQDTDEILNCFVKSSG